MSLRDRVAIVTGGTRGIGHAIALGFAKEGATIVIADIDPAQNLIESQFRELETKFMVEQTDVSEESHVKSLIAKVIAKFGRIDILVNNAGLMMRAFGYPEDGCPVSEIRTEAWDRIINVNLRGPFLCSRATLPHMARLGHGSIINISSGAGKEGRAGRGPYVASKFALEGLTQVLSKEVKETNVAVNALNPGAIVLTALVKTESLIPSQREKLLKPEVAVPAAIFLALQDGHGITGQSLSALGWNQEHGLGGIDIWRARS